jgi:hypothetical protein
MILHRINEFAGIKSLESSFGRLTSRMGIFIEFIVFLIFN